MIDDGACLTECHRQRGPTPADRTMHFMKSTMYALRIKGTPSGAIQEPIGAAGGEARRPCALPDRRHRKAVFFVSIILFAILAGMVLPAAAEEVVQIRVINRDVNDILTIVQPLVSPHGYISADIPSNSLIVIDQPAVVNQIRALVSRIDQPVPQLRIRVQYGYEDSREGQSASVEGRVQVGDATIGVGDKASEGIEAELSAGKNRRRSKGDYMVMVRSGSTAYISSGYDVPYPERWSRLSRRHGHTRGPVAFKKVDTGYDVRPVLVGEMVQIEITPHISYLDGRGFRQPIRFAEAATRLNVPLGQWVEIAGTNDATQEIYSQILSAGRTSSGEQLSMRLMVTRN